jgi:hypothetical protein
MDAMLSYLETAYNDGQKYRLHYVTAREMYVLIRAAEGAFGGEAHQSLSTDKGTVYTCPHKTPA